MAQARGEQIEGRQAYQEAVQQLFGLARMQIALYSGSLPADEYASSELISTLRGWVLGNQRARMRILLHAPRLAVSRPNPLLNLGLQLPSFFSFRDTPARHLPMGDMLVIDELHLLRRSQTDSRSATLKLHDALAARESLRQFDALWEESRSSSEVRRHAL